MHCDQDIIDQHCQETIILYDKLLDRLSIFMNSTFAIERSTAFWDKLLCVYLVSFIQIVRGHGQTYDLPRETADNVEAKPVRDWLDLTLQCVGKSGLVPLSVGNPKKFRIPQRSVSIPEAKSPSMATWIDRLIFRLSRRLLCADANVPSTLTRPLLKTFGSIRYSRYQGPRRRAVQIDWSLRKRLVDQLLNHSISGFERYAIQHLVWGFPTCFLEEFKHFYDWSEYNSQRFRIVIYSNLMYNDPSFQYLLAWIGERKGVLIGHAHGAFYGQLRSFLKEYTERRLATDYITWGWTDHHYPGKCSPLPNPRLSEIARREVIEENKIIWIGNSFYKNVHSIWSTFLPSFGAAYYEFRDRVYSRLDSAVLTSLYYRPYKRDFGWRQEAEFEARFPAGQVIKQDWSAEMQSASLLLIDHLGTSLLEAIALEIPVVCFWDENAFALRNDASSYFAELRNCGILYHDPDKAAAHINTIGIDPLEWWNCDHTLKARRRFRNRFAAVSSDYIRDWIEFIESRITDSQSVNQSGNILN